ncbi:hypothetical protein D3C71_50740 [compost metagenome]
MGLYKTAKSELTGVFDNKYVAWGLIIGTGYLAIRFVNGGLSGLGSIGNGLTNLFVKNKVLASNPGVTTPQYEAAQSIADGLARSFGKYKTSNPNSTWDEDEDQICSLINSIQSADQAKLVKQIYQAITGYDLYSNYDTYVHWPDGADDLHVSWIK